MRVLILEDEPILAMDLEDIVESRSGAECVVADSVEAGLMGIERGVDFAMLDIHLGGDGETSLPVAQELLRRRIPFCFISSRLDDLPSSFHRVPKVGKPFQARDIAGVLPALA
ncbi:response regulator [Consotaella aegiceratis]|uniref:response regulator n=1 Tax=Consotaella aegiceratis TaxID=3097961 RepID=UPI002F4139E9